MGSEGMGCRLSASSPRLVIAAAIVALGLLGACGSDKRVTSSRQSGAVPDCGDESRAEVTVIDASVRNAISSRAFAESMGLAAASLSRYRWVSEILPGGHERARVLAVVVDVSSAGDTHTVGLTASERDGEVEVGDWSGLVPGEPGRVADGHLTIGRTLFTTYSFLYGTTDLKDARTAVEFIRFGSGRTEERRVELCENVFVFHAGPSSKPVEEMTNHAITLTNEVGAELVRVDLDVGPID